MKAVVVCPRHSVAVTDGQLGWRLEAEESRPVLHHLPHFIREGDAVAQKQRMWVADTSEMTCPQTDGECHEGWEIHTFDTDGCWLAYND